MTGLLITREVRAEILQMIERAEAHPLPWSFLKDAARDDVSDVLELKDRTPGFERPPSEHMIIPMGYSVAFSIEEQPAGWCKHLSISVHQPGKIPNQAAVDMIADEFGIAEVHKIWLEEFAPGHMAVNLIYLYRPRTEITT